MDLTSFIEVSAGVSQTPPVVILVAAEAELNVDGHDHAVDHTQTQPHHQVEKCQHYHLCTEVFKNNGLLIACIYTRGICSNLLVQKMH